MSTEPSSTPSGLAPPGLAPPGLAPSGSAPPGAPADDPIAAAIEAALAAHPLPALASPARPAASGEPDPEAVAVFDLDARWQRHPRVAIRPERFGALLYHFGTRRLSFLKNQTMLGVLRALDEAPSARAACLHAGVAEADLDRYATALGTLARSQMIIERSRG